MYYPLKDHPNWKINKMGNLINPNGIKHLPYIEPSGYSRIEIDGKKYYIHRLVAIQFLPKPFYMNEVDHINMNRSDNRVLNLRWSSREMNNMNKVDSELLMNNINKTKFGTYRVRNKDGDRKSFKTMQEAIIFKYSSKDNPI